MIERKFPGGPIIVRCDGCSREHIDTGERILTPAVRKAQAVGWTLRNMGTDQGWRHFGPYCTATRAWENPDAVRVNIPRNERAK